MHPSKELMTSNILDLTSYFSKKIPTSAKLLNGIRVTILTRFGDRIFYEIQTFRNLFEPVRRYGPETWIVSVRLSRRLDGAYTNLITQIWDISWRSHATLNRIYGNQSLFISRKKRLQNAGYCHRTDREVVSFLLLWHLSGGVFSRKLTFPDNSSGLGICHRGSLDTKTKANSVERDYHWSSDQPPEGRRMMMIIRQELPIQKPSFLYQHAGCDSLRYFLRETP